MPKVSRPAHYAYCKCGKNEIYIKDIISFDCYENIVCPACKSKFYVKIEDIMKGLFAPIKIGDNNA